MRNGELMIGVSNKGKIAKLPKEIRKGDGDEKLWY